MLIFLRHDLVKFTPSHVPFVFKPDSVNSIKIRCLWQHKLASFVAHRILQQLFRVVESCVRVCSTHFWSMAIFEYKMQDVYSDAFDAFWHKDTESCVFVCGAWFQPCSRSDEVTSVRSLDRQKPNPSGADDARVTDTEMRGVGLGCAVYAPHAYLCRSKLKGSFTSHKLNWTDLI